MRWSYKTVLYELKKEGLLGSSFLDESEIELSLNEFGAAGWELISMLETRDGLIAVLKQPFGPLAGQKVNEDTEVEFRVKDARPQPVLLREDELEEQEQEPVKKEREETGEKNTSVSGIGSIRIE